LGSLAGFACGAIRLQHALSESIRASAASMVLSELAHQINNPLQAVVLAVSCANSSNDLSPEVRAMTMIAEKELQRVVSLSAELVRKPV
jgi:hypothetical protein